MTSNLLPFFGLKFHPFRPDLPIEALRSTPAIERFCRRVEFTIADGGFASITGDPGTGKSVALRLLAHHLGQQRDVIVGSIDHPQSRVADFYREMGDLFGVTLQHNNRWGGFKGLRQRWSEHVASTFMRPVLIIDEAQEMLSTTFSELRILASKEFDSRSLLCVVFAGDQRLPNRLQQPDLLPLASRIRRRLHLDYAERDELCACLDHLLEAAGNAALMTTELKTSSIPATRSFRFDLAGLARFLRLGGMNTTQKEAMSRQPPVTRPRHRFEVFELTLGVIRSLRPLVTQIGRHDKGLTKQLHEAASSIALNLAEGNRRIGKDRAYFFRIAARRRNTSLSAGRRSLGPCRRRRSGATAGVARQYPRDPLPAHPLTGRSRPGRPRNFLASTARPGRVLAHQDVEPAEKKPEAWPRQPDRVDGPGSGQAPTKSENKKGGSPPPCLRHLGDEPAVFV